MQVFRKKHRRKAAFSRYQCQQRHVSHYITFSVRFPTPFTSAPLVFRVKIVWEKIAFQPKKASIDLQYTSCPQSNGHSKIFALRSVLQRHGHVFPEVEAWKTHLFRFHEKRNRLKQRQLIDHIDWVKEFVWQTLWKGMINWQHIADVYKGNET